MTKKYPTPFLMSIEHRNGESFTHHYHLGTDEKLARRLCVERFHGRIELGMPTITVALLDANKKIIDVYNGEWYETT